MEEKLKELTFQEKLQRIIDIVTDPDWVKQHQVSIDSSTPGARRLYKGRKIDPHKIQRRFNV